MAIIRIVINCPKAGNVAIIALPPCPLIDAGTEGTGRTAAPSKLHRQHNAVSRGEASPD
jgi:hypothetical protein